jgi:hypothetical protein
MVFSNSQSVINFNFDIVIDNNNENSYDPLNVFRNQRVTHDCNIPTIKFLSDFMDPSL